MTKLYCMQGPAKALPLPVQPEYQKYQDVESRVWLGVRRDLDLQSSESGTTPDMWRIRRGMNMERFGCVGVQLAVVTVTFSIQNYRHTIDTRQLLTR